MLWYASLMKPIHNVERPFKIFEVPNEYFLVKSSIRNHKCHQTKKTTLTKDGYSKFIKNLKIHEKFIFENWNFFNQFLVSYQPMNWKVKLNSYFLRYAEISTKKPWKYVMVSKIHYKVWIFRTLEVLICIWQIDSRPRYTFSNSRHAKK